MENNFSVPGSQISACTQRVDDIPFLPTMHKWFEAGVFRSTVSCDQWVLERRRGINADILMFRMQLLHEYSRVAHGDPLAL